MSMQRACKICGVDYDPENSEVRPPLKVYGVSAAISSVCYNFYSIHRNWILQFLESYTPDYDEVICSNNIATCVRVTLTKPSLFAKDLGDGIGIEIDMYEDRVVFKRLYDIEGDQVRMKLRVEKI